MANIALIIIYILAGMGLLISANQHGKPSPDNNFWLSLLSRAISMTIIWWALGWSFI